MTVPDRASGLRDRRSAGRRTARPGQRLGARGAGAVTVRGVQGAEPLQLRGEPGVPGQVVQLPWVGGPVVELLAASAPLAQPGVGPRALADARVDRPGAAVDRVGL